jgi:hypothetical protein
VNGYRDETRSGSLSRKNNVLNVSAEPLLQEDKKTASASGESDFTSNQGGLDDTRQ